ncbi:hypothetical protein KUCAC02_037582, partial [Chaenocephalus aceratus]
RQEGRVDTLRDTSFRSLQQKHDHEEEVSFRTSWMRPCPVGGGEPQDQLVEALSCWRRSASGPAEEVSLRTSWLRPCPVRGEEVSLRTSWLRPCPVRG